MNVGALVTLVAAVHYLYMREFWVMLHASPILYRYIDWSIYPLGYFFGYLMGAVDDDVLNLVYNLADFVNKIAFCLAIWASAKKSTLASKGELGAPLLPQ